MNTRLRLLLVLLLLLAAAGFVWWRQSHRSASSHRLTLYGNVDLRTVQLAFDGQGRVMTMQVEEGNQVQPGQLLATLDSAKLDAELAEAKAQMSAQEAVVRRLETGTRKQEIEQFRARVVSVETRLANAEQVFKRLTQTAASGAVSQQRLDDARAQVDIERASLNEARQALALAVEGPRQEDIDEAKAKLQANQARVRLLEQRLADTRLHAPSPGTIQSRLLQPGDYATSARPAYTLALTHPKWIRTYVPEPDLGRVHPGAHASVLSDSFPNRTFDGWVGFISPVAEFTPKAVETTDLRTRLVYEVRVYVKDPDDRLRLGMPTTVTLDETAPATQPTTRAKDAQ